MQDYRIDTIIKSRSEEEAFKKSKLIVTAVVLPYTIDLYFLVKSVI